MTFGYAAFTLKNSSPFDPEWDEAMSMAVNLLEREQEKLSKQEFPTVPIDKNAEEIKNILKELQNQEENNE